MAVFAVMGGSGLYESGAVPVSRTHDVDTPWGKPSGPVVECRVGEHTVLFLPRHGSGHSMGPAQVPFRANVAAVKHLGATAILSISAVGSLQEKYAPGDIVIPDQFIDRTRHRQDSYFGDGLVAHVSLADPFCATWSRQVAQAIPTQVQVHHGGVYLNMEGPQFSTRAESHWYRSMGAAVIGMTNLTEARLAREAELCYASFAFVTDYDCWKDDHAVTVDEVLEVLAQNSAVGKSIIANLAAIQPEKDCCCRHALQHAILTAPQARREATCRDIRYLHPSVDI